MFHRACAQACLRLGSEAAARHLPRASPGAVRAVHNYLPNFDAFVKEQMIFDRRIMLQESALMDKENAKKIEIEEEKEREIKRKEKNADVKKMMKIVENDLTESERDPDEEEVKTAPEKKKTNPFDTLRESLVVNYILRMGRHTKVIPGQRIFSNSALVLVGTGEGTAGFGYGKAMTPTKAIAEAYKDCFNNMVSIYRWEDRTITTYMRVKYGATQLIIYPRAPGSGIKAGKEFQHYCDAFGLTDIGIKLIGSNDKMAIMYCFFKAMKMQRHPEESARRAGKLLFDERKVW
eukprot:CAMPEP_0177659112 /NCGR_PEP_ID=MMETSP0447-20121125/17253_1 /TAXON_ID=0 /ORGANISM="Stygamoeba regulata, Strain BSH-02190019" /LENGTH=290 /DNA_ID=CAMNT_0019163929 /DNA_START=114 /DNA_END=983 /DNA_ORIENTATION=-